MESQLEGFIQAINNIPIMTITDPWWHYSITRRFDAIQLTACRLSEISFDVDDSNNVHFRTSIIKGCYEVINRTFRKLTVEEYAKKYGVEEVTVRQWIRRGKLRSAEKIGKEWKIPESEDIPKRGYKTGTYSFNIDYFKRRDEIPLEPFPFLRDTENITIFQNEDDKNMFTVLCGVCNSWEPMTLQMDTKEREKLELFLISTPYFKSNGTKSGGTSTYSTTNGLSFFSYFGSEVTLEDLEKTGPGIEADDLFDINMKLDGFVIDDDKVWFKV